MRKSYINLRTFELLQRAIELKYQIKYKIEKFNDDESGRFPNKSFDEFAEDAIEIVNSAEEINVDLGRYRTPRKAVQAFQELPMSTATQLYNGYVERRNRLREATKMDDECRKSFKRAVMYAMDNLQLDKVINKLRIADREYFGAEIQTLEKLNRFELEDLVYIKSSNET